MKFKLKIYFFKKVKQTHAYNLINVFKKKSRTSFWCTQTKPIDWQLALTSAKWVPFMHLNLLLIFE